MLPSRFVAALAFAFIVLSPLGCAQYGDFNQPIGQAVGQPMGQPIGQPIGQPWGGQYGAGPEISCESRDGGFRECATPFRGAPVMTATLSSAPCVEGRTWGSRGAGSVWVNGGCRARFADAYAYGGPAGGGYDSGQSVRCESLDGRERSCQAPVGGRLVLLRQLSDAACIEGQSWGSQGSGRVWVRNGCRGDFGLAPGTAAVDGATFRCESDGGRHQECRARTSGQQVLVRQLSAASCIEGQSWGSRDGSVWVRNGCRAEFGPAGGWGQGAYAGGQQITCSSENQRYRSCAWDTRWGHPRLLQQLSNESCREGQSWGYDGRGQLWVDRGCRGRFGVR